MFYNVYMFDVETRLIEGNKSFRRKIGDNPKYLETVKKQVSGQSPYALVITCSDSRVVPEQIFDTFLGELFVIRTAGNVINEGELATCEYAFKHLNIKYCLVLGHTHCGAIHAAIHKEKGEYLAPILDNISNSIHDEKDEVKASELNAKKQRDYLKDKFPGLDVKIKAGIYNIEDNSFKLLGE